MKFQERIALAMQKGGLNGPSALANEASKHHSEKIKVQAIQYLLNPKNNPQKSQFTRAIALACGVSYLWLTEEIGDINDASFQSSHTLSDRGTHEPTNVQPHENSELIHSLPDPVPLISSVQAGAWREAIDLNHPGIGEKMIPTTKPHSPSAFALRVEGDSMTSPYGRSFWDGMYIVVDPEQAAYNGDLVVAKINGDDKVTFKKLVIDGSKTFLMPLNPQYPPIYDEFRILGKVIQGSFDT